MTNETNAIAKRDDNQIQTFEQPGDGFTPSNVEQALWFSKQLFDSKLLPTHVKSPQAAFAIIVTGHELGLSPMQALRTIHVIEGKPALSADIMIALCMSKPICKKFELIESNGLIATYETHREGQSPKRMSFTIEDARTAELMGKGNWKKYPAAMLRARCIAALARAVYPDVLAGVYTTEELEGDERPAQARIVSTEPVEATIIEHGSREDPKPAKRSNGARASTAWRDWWRKRLGDELAADVFGVSVDQLDSYQQPTDKSELDALIKALEAARRDLDAPPEVTE